MKQIIALWCVLWCSSVLAAVTVHIPIQQWYTANGLSVWFVQRKQLPMVDATMIIDAGSARDTIPGMANITAHGLSLGTQHNNEQQLAQNLAKIGAQFSVNVKRDFTVLHLRTLSKMPYRLQAAGWLSGVLSEPTFAPAGLTELKRKWTTIMHYRAKQAAAVAQQLFWQHLYAGTAYAHPIIGTPTSMAQITQTGVQAFYNQYYVARNAQLILVGDMSRKQAMQFANAIAVKLPMGEAAASYHIVPHYTDKHVHQYLPSAQTTLLIGQRALLPNSPQRFALEVDNEILGGGQFFSLLYQQIRAEQGLVYGIGSSVLRRHSMGPFIIQAQTRNQQAQDALMLIRAVVADFVKQGPTPQQLTLAKQALIGHFPLALASNAGLSHALVRMAFYHLPMTYLATYQKNIQAVTLAQAKAALAVLHPHRLLTVQVGG